MRKQILAMMLSWALIAPTGAKAKTQAERALEIKQQVSEIPVGSIVEVRTVDKVRLRGRISEATDEGFGVQIVRNQKMETAPVRFMEAKSLKVVTTVEQESRKSSAGKTAGWLALGGLATLGIIVLIAAITLRGN